MSGKDYTSFDTHWTKGPGMLATGLKFFIGGSVAMGWATPSSDLDLHVRCDDMLSSGELLWRLWNHGLTLSFKEDHADYICTAKGHIRGITPLVEYKFLTPDAWDEVREEYVKAAAHPALFDRTKSKIENYRARGISCKPLTFATLHARIDLILQFHAQQEFEKVRARMVPYFTQEGWPQRR